MIVVDASVLVLALGADGSDGAIARHALEGQTLTAPELIDLEVVSALRRHAQAGHVPVDRAALAVADLAALPMRRSPHRPLLQRCWELRESVTPYDAAYVALAEALGTALLTADARLSRASGVRCPIALVSR